VLGLSPLLESVQEVSLNTNWNDCGWNFAKQRATALSQVLHGKASLGLIGPIVYLSLSYSRAVKGLLFHMKIVIRKSSIRKCA